MFGNTFSRIRVIAIVLTAALLVASAANSALAQFVMMPDSTNNRLVLFDPNNGALINSNAFGLAGGTPIHAMQVGSEIWVSEQLGDRVSRWSFTGTPIGAVTGALDNLRGMELIGDTVYLCNDGTGNGAPGAAIYKIAMNGTLGGSFSTPFSSPFGILSYQGNMLVSSDAANDDIHQYTQAGASVGTFYNTATLNFAEQMWYDLNGNVLAAGFSSNNIVRLNGANGALINDYTGRSGARGVYQLANGNILWSNSAGAHVFDPNTGVSTQVYTGGGRYFDDLIIPEPASLALITFGGLALRLRRRS